MVKILSYITFLFLFLACDGKKTEDDTPQNKDETKKEISAKAIESFKYNDYVLSTDAESQVRNWSKFQELETQISYLKTADIVFFTEEKDTLKKFMDSLRISIPDTINTSPVNARITALETKLLKLNNDFNLGNYASEKKLQSIKELLVANSNLIFVINKKLEFDKNDIGRPEGEIEPDSLIEKLELELENSN